MLYAFLLGVTLLSAKAFLRPAFISFICALPAAAAHGQVFTVKTEQVEGRFLQFQPTHVELPKMKAGSFTQERLMRTLSSEQGVAMRPLPLASKGLDAI